MTEEMKNKEVVENEELRKGNATTEEELLTEIKKIREDVGTMKSIITAVLVIWILAIGFYIMFFLTSSSSKPTSTLWNTPQQTLQCEINAQQLDI